MATICYIGKFPPIQGGVSSSSLWQLIALANAGHYIHIISNCWEVEEEYRQYFTGEDLEIFQNILELSNNRLYFHFTNPFFEPHHIPFNHLYISKLTSKSIQVINKYNCDFIYSYYFEPYGVAAYITSKMTGKPYILRHAGSDITRLLECKELTDIYLNIIKSASYFITQGFKLPAIITNNIDHSKIKRIDSDFLPEEIFNNNGKELNIKNFLESIDEHVKSVKLNNWNNHNFDNSKINFGIYCKSGFHKGILEIVKALNLIDGIENKVNLIIVTGGKSLKKLQKQIKSSSKTLDHIFFLPFIPPWKIPEFIRACDAVFSLENNFPIEIHGPRIAREVLSCGKCLIVASEIANKQIFSRDLNNFDNCIIINNVQDIKYLSNIIEKIVNGHLNIKNIGDNGYIIANKYSLTDSSKTISEFESIFNIIKN